MPETSAAMLRLRFENWSVEFPQEWDHEIEGDILSIAPGEDGCVLQISSMSKEADLVGDEDLWEFMEEAGVETSDIARVELGDFTGLVALAQEDAAAMRYWVLRAGQDLILATYRTPANQAEADIAAVEGVLKSLKLETEAPILAAPASRAH